MHLERHVLQNTTAHSESNAGLLQEVFCKI